MEPDPTNEICYLDGNSERTLFFCKPVRDKIPGIAENIVDVAAECKFNSFVWPDGRGFAVNFGHVFELYDYYQAYDEKTGKRITKIPALDETKLPTCDYKIAGLFGTPIAGDGTAIIFNDSYILYLPVKRLIVEALREGPIDLRTPPTPRSPQQSRDLRL